MDTIFIAPEVMGKPWFKKISISRRESEEPFDFSKMFKKADSGMPDDLETWLSPYYDDTPIGPATYAIRWLTFLKLLQFKDSKHPMSDAWKAVAPAGIDLMEFIFDMRKDDPNKSKKQKESEIRNRLGRLRNISRQIKKAQEGGNFFANSVTCSMVQNVPDLLNKFDKLQDYLDYITGQNYEKTESIL